MNPPIVIFDGICNLCNATVDFIIRHDKTESILFAPFQSESGLGKGAELLRQFGITDAPVSVLVIYNGQLLSESTAILFLGKYMEWPSRQVALFLCRCVAMVPRPLLDAIYRWIARNRYRWFGQKDSCRLPSPSERERFL